MNIILITLRHFYVSLRSAAILFTNMLIANQPRQIQKEQNLRSWTFKTLPHSKQWKQGRGVEGRVAILKTEIENNSHQTDEVRMKIEAYNRGKTFFSFFLPVISNHWGRQESNLREGSTILPILRLHYFPKLQVKPLNPPANESTV